MNEKVIENIVKWNEERGLLNTPFNLKREMGMILEEVLEGFGFSKKIAKERGLELANDFYESSFDMVGKNELIDSFGDIAFIAIGSIAKLSADPEVVLADITEANQQKGSKVDENGKIIKDDSFIEPKHFDEVNSESSILADEEIKEIENRIKDLAEKIIMPKNSKGNCSCEITPEKLFKFFKNFGFRIEKFADKSKPKTMKYKFTISEI